MAVKINPIRLSGAWDDGYALDLHTVNSVFLGDDPYGHPVFDTTRSEIGELLYRLKYGKDRSTVDVIADTVADFLRGWSIGVDALVPVPPSNIGRSVQPVIEVARAVCKRTGIPLCQECVKKVRGTGQLKDVFEFEKRAAALTGAFAVDPGLIQGKRLLLFDDLYRSGATVDQIARTLTAEGRAAAVFVLALTRTRSKA